MINRGSAMKKKNEKIKEEEVKEETEEIQSEEIVDNSDQEVKESSKEKELTLEDKYEKLLKENAQLNDKLIRKAAEFENFRRRSIADKSNWIKNATERLVIELCDVVDNFERALHPDLKKTDHKAFKKGIELIYQQLENLLKKEGVTKIDAEKQEFDPNLHEAMVHIPSELDENTVAAVIQNGYKMNDKIIRPARVAVSNGKKPEKEKENKTKK